MVSAWLMDRIRCQWMAQRPQKRCCQSDLLIFNSMDDIPPHKPQAHTYPNPKQQAWSEWSAACYCVLSSSSKDNRHQSGSVSGETHHLWPQDVQDQMNAQINCVGTRSLVMCVPRITKILLLSSNITSEVLNGISPSTNSLDARHQTNVWHRDYFIQPAAPYMRHLSFEIRNVSKEADRTKAKNQRDWLNVNIS